jgi:energy-coupling factor transport system ATP-binding protein
MEIKLENICYNDKLLDVSCKIETGKVTSIVGNSGSGKSMIGFIIMGIVDGYSGKIKIDGTYDYDKYSLMKDVGYVYQNPWEHFFCETVYDEIAFGLKQFRFKLPKIEIQVRNALKMVGLDDSYFKKKISTLSSGEAERVAIASSLVLNPKALILDEPTIYLDDKVKGEIIKLIKMLRDKYKKTVIVMSNDMDFVFDISDKCVVMDKGSIIKSGSIDAILLDDSLSRMGIDLPKMCEFVKEVRERYGVSLKYTSKMEELVGDVVDNV